MLTIKTDFLVFGCGVAGLYYALNVADNGKVLILAKRSSEESSTSMAQGGIAAVSAPEDNFENHIKDTLLSGDGLCNEDIVETVVSEGPSHIERLISLGARFCGNKGSPLDLHKEGGHSHRRIVHAKDATGKELIRALLLRCKRHPNIKMLEDHVAVNLITDATIQKSKKPSKCFGAYVLCKRTNEVLTVAAKATMIATGGIGKVYLYTSNPDTASGDGIAMAYRAGAKVANMEFVQFHPTCLYHHTLRTFLISEAVRGEGAHLILKNGARFMRRYDPRGELATRDIVARAIDSELKRTGDEHVMLDISHLDARLIKNKFPNIYKKCLSVGMDITKKPIPVVPAAHYLCGGIVCDSSGATELDGLYVAGEAACTGLHGANRLASNSLLEALVFASRAAIASRERAKEPSGPRLPTWKTFGASSSDESVVITQNWDEIRRMMWNYVGIVRSNKRLTRALKRIDLLDKEIQEYYWNFKITSDLVELRNVALNARLVIECALKRLESRGLHYNLDYPKKNKRFLKDTIV